MAPTTLTTVVMIAMGLGLLALASWAWFGSWQPEPRRAADRLQDAEYRLAVQQMRRAIDDYEQGRRTL